MMGVTLPLISDTKVEYTNLDCSIAEVDTRKLIYSAEIFLNPELFNDPLGYYITWQRCCRNYSIQNIYSENPQAGGVLFAGQTFNLEIPPVVKDGQPFVNSSPRLFPPLSDYGVVGRPYYVFFGGTDDDGDSLVYSLANPLNTFTADAGIPGPNFFARPKAVVGGGFPEVNWRPGFSLDRVMQGNPDLAISEDGQLTITPTLPGLFVFAVLCEEFRDRKKIGETRRDFQMFSDILPNSVAPIIKGRNLAEPTFAFRDNMTITFPAGTPDDQRCIEVEVSDQDIFNANEGNQEKVAIRVIGLGKKKNINKGEVELPQIKTATLTQSNGTAIFKICFDECPPDAHIPYQIGIIAADDACALPLLDTLRITVLVQTPVNNPVQFVNPGKVLSASLNEGSQNTYPFNVFDPDGDSLTITHTFKGFVPENVGMTFNYTQLVEGTSEGSLFWFPECDKYDFSVKRDFEIKIVADDKDYCRYNKADTAYYKLKMIPPPDNDPVIDTDITAVYSERLAEESGQIFQTIQFGISGHDADDYEISLEAQGVGFKMSDYGMLFPPAAGVHNINSTYTWALLCDKVNLKRKDEFLVRFRVVDDNNWCKIYQADTVDVTVKVLPPPNAKPLISLENLHPETTVAANTAASFTNQSIDFMVRGADSDESPVVDNITIELIEATGNVEPDGYTFNSVAGLRNIQSKFSWQPGCSIYDNDIFENQYEFKFRVFDDHCQSVLADTIILNLHVKDYLHEDTEFLPASAITPNKDGKNDYFALEGYGLRDDGSNPDDDVNLPADNCLNRFEYIRIYNRWGKQVYQSENRLFRWYAPDAAAGVYYYLVKFTNKAYKGAVMVRH